MTLFRILLGSMFLGIASYTTIAFLNYGWDLFTPFFSGVISLTWPGQFHYDFTCYLLLSGLWIMWRNQFTPASIGLGIAASILGIFFLAPYLMVLTYQTEGRLSAVLLGKQS
ncbi:MAG: hypothetical protein O9264_03930 [Leptospira sp.]|nr:hypothetical protein [Leptospira sp.]